MNASVLPRKAPNRSLFSGPPLGPLLPKIRALEISAHGSTPTPGFLTSRDETQTMVQAKLRPKLRPRQTLYLLGKGETQTMV